MTAEFKIYLATWNVAETLPPKDLKPLLSLDKIASDADLADIYAIGLQELRSDTTTLLNDSIFDDPWTTSITNHLTPWDYVRIKSLRLVGIHLAVYVKRRHLVNISNIESEYTRTGMGGLWGNKGGLSIRFELNGVNFCFVNSHLSAHTENFSQRIEDYNQVVMTQKFRDASTPSILDHDYVFWMGDLNFRLDDVSNDVSRKKIEQKDLAFLLQHDQLNQARLKDMILIDFDEGDITFPPTYKFDPQTDKYDTSSKGRVPAWCDRILWRVHEDSFHGTSLKAHQLFYTSLPSFKNSDHKPVVSAFNVKTLDRATPSPVVFEPLSSWSRNRDQKVSFSIPRGFPTSGRDWVGLYPSHFKHFEDYVAFSWLGPRSSDAFDDSCFLFSVPFEERFLDKLAVGSYMLLYFSAVKNCVISYSNEFKLLDVDESSSSSSSDAEGVEGKRQKLLRISSSRLQSAVLCSSSAVATGSGVASGVGKGTGGSGGVKLGSDEVVEKLEEAVVKGNVFVSNTSKVEASAGKASTGVVGGEVDGVGRESDSIDAEISKTSSGAGAGAFEDAYMKLREEGYREKERELEERRKGGGQEDRKANLEITESLTEEEKRLRMQAVDQLITNTHLHNVTSDLDDLMDALDDGMKGREEDDDAGDIKARNEFKLLVEDGMGLAANVGGNEMVVKKEEGGVECEMVRKVEGMVDEGVRRVDSGVIGCSTINYLGGMHVGAELPRSDAFQEEVRKAFDACPTREVTATKDHKDQHYTGSIKKDVSLTDFELAESFEEISGASKTSSFDNQNNNMNRISTTKPSFPSPLPPSSPLTKPPATNTQAHTLVDSPFEGAYMEEKKNVVVGRKEEEGVSMGDVEGSVDGMLSNLNLDDFSESLGLNPSGKMKQAELDEERWREAARDGDVKVAKQYDLLIDDQSRDAAHQQRGHDFDSAKKNVDGNDDVKKGGDGNDSKLDKGTGVGSLDVSQKKVSDV